MENNDPKINKYLFLTKKKQTSSSFLFVSYFHVLATIFPFFSKKNITASTHFHDTSHEIHPSVLLPQLCVV